MLIIYFVRRKQTFDKRRVKLYSQKYFVGKKHSLKKGWKQNFLKEKQPCINFVCGIYNLKLTSALRRATLYSHTQTNLWKFLCLERDWTFEEKCFVRVTLCLMKDWTFYTNNFWEGKVRLKEGLNYFHKNVFWKKRTWVKRRVKQK